MQIVADRLRSIGIEVPDQDLVLYTIQSLRSDFESFVTALSMRSNYPFMVEFTSFLLAHEARLLTNLRSSSTSTAHLTTCNTGSNFTHQNTTYYTNFKPCQSDQPNRGRTYNNRGRTDYRRRGKSCQNNLNPEQSQTQ
jgi:gag-polypeptide of LTR copia-type